MIKKSFLAIYLMGLGAATASAQLNSSVSVEGEYQPLIIETERLNSFPQGYRFELPPANLEYEFTGFVTDYRPSLLTMGATGRLTDWPWKKRRGFIDARLGSYLNSRVHAGYYILDSKANTLLAELKFRSTAYRDPYALPDPNTNRLYEGGLALHYDGFYGDAHEVHAAAEGNYTAYDRGASEWNLNAGAAYAYNFNETNRLGIDVKGDFHFPHDIYRNYGNVTLKPAYRYADERLLFKAGVDFDITYDAMGSSRDKKFGTFHAAPDVSLQYRINRGVGVFIEATGGVAPASATSLRGSDPFYTPWLFTAQPVYTPADIRGGVGIGPFYGFAASLAVRYAATRNVPLEAWQDFLYSDSRTVNLHGFGVDCEVRYSYGSMVTLSFEGSYTPQKATRGLFNGFDRPRWVLDAKAAVRPIGKLKIEAGYGYRGVRNYYEWSSAGSLDAFRMADITDLNAKITYSLLDNLDIYIKGGNLLNRRVELIPGLQSEGIALSGGLYFEF